MTGSERTTAVVVHYARDELTDAIVGDLTSVAAASVERVVVVDNGSPLPYALSVPASDVELVRLSEGRGFAGAAHAGRSRVRGEHFLLLNNDVRLPHDPVPTMLTRLRAGAALVGPRIEFPDGRFQLSWGDELGLLEERRERRRQRQMRRGGGAVIADRERESAIARRVAWLSGVAMLVDTNAFDAVGGFDQGYFFYFEDVDLCRRLRDVGHDLWYEPSARVVHLLGGTRDDHAVQVPESVATAHVLGHLRYYSRHRPRWERQALKSLLTVQVALSPLYRRQPWQHALLQRIWKD